jgi:hypothetical protein
MRSSFNADHVLDILSLDVDPNSFYEVFFSEASRKGIDLPALDDSSDLGRDEDVVQAVSALALRAVKNSQYGGSRAEMCRDRGISSDKAYRLNKFLRGAEVFSKEADNVYVGCQRYVSYHREDGESRLRVVAQEKASDAYREQIGVDVSGNEATITASDTDISSVDDLISYAGLDENKWRRVDSNVKCYEQGMKMREILKFKDNGEPIYVERKESQQLHSFHVKLERKQVKPVEFEPLRPVEISVTQQYEADPPQRRPDGLKTALFVPDPQIGFRRSQRTGRYSPIHDRRALDVMLQVAAQIDPDDIIVLGDWLDMTNWTKKYTQSQEFRETTNPALQEGKWWLQNLGEQHPGAEKHYLLGNHEDRVRNSLINHYGQAYNVRPGGRMEEPPLMSIRTMLELDDLGYEVSDPYPQGEVWLNDAVKGIHGESAAKRVCRNLMEKHNVTTIQGHNHRIEMKSSTMQFRSHQQPIHGVTAGCLCRTDPGVVPAVSNRMDWQQGLVAVQYEEGGTDHSVDLIRIHEGQCFFRGQVFEAQPQADQIRSDTDFGEKMNSVFPVMEREPA